VPKLNYVRKNIGGGGFASPPFPLSSFRVSLLFTQLSPPCSRPILFFLILSFIVFPSPRAGARELKAPQIQVWDPYNEGLGRRARPSPEAVTLLAFGRSLKAANLPTFKNIGNAKNQIQFVLSLQKMKSNRPQYVTDYYTLMKSNRLVHQSSKQVFGWPWSGQQGTTTHSRPTQKCHATPKLK